MRTFPGIRALSLPHHSKALASYTQALGGSPVHQFWDPEGPCTQARLAASGSGSTFATDSLCLRMRSTIFGSTCCSCHRPGPYATALTHVQSLRQVISPNGSCLLSHFCKVSCMGFDPPMNLRSVREGWDAGLQDSGIRIHLPHCSSERPHACPLRGWRQWA